ncbi:hypothetical protein B4Q13_16205 [Lacticaseibacillus rhamnosus]
MDLRKRPFGQTPHQPALILAACAHQPPVAYGQDIPGFFYGLLHGFIAPFSLIGSFFDASIRAYAFPNTGWWYDLGFVMGIGGLAGGGAKQT